MTHAVCEHCGCSLDFGEKCDCQNEQKEKDRPHANETGPQKAAETAPSSNNIAQKREKVNTSALRKLREDKQIPAKDIVTLVQEKYPKYDKTLQSKCERGEEYGIDLKSDAMDAILAKYAPEELEAIKRKRRGGHRLICKISCRLEDDEYSQLIIAIKDDGFDQMQAWLTYMVRNYLKAKKGAN